MTNQLQVELREKRYKFTKLKDSSTLPDFLLLTKADILRITLGCYQLNNTGHYLQDTLGRDDGNIVKICNLEAEAIVKMKFFCSISRARHHYAYVHYGRSDSDDSGVIGYYCDCQSGARTVGTCSHVTALLVYYSLPGNHVANWSDYDDFIEHTRRRNHDSDDDDEEIKVEF